MFKDTIKSILAHPRIRDSNIDDPGTTLCHSQIIQKKSFLKKVYLQWYDSILRSMGENTTGSVLELGSGAGFLKDVLPDLITSEILRVPHVDIVLDGHYLPFVKAALSGIVMIDVFHHLPNANLFFSEASYCVKPGGRIVMIEPWTTSWSRRVYQYLHHEPFDPDSKEWHFQKTGPLSGANQALAWIVFKRDRTKFEQEFPQWHIREIELHTPFSYLLSGGVSFRSLIPGWLFDLVRRIEAKLTPWMDVWAMFATITLGRNDV
jgi:SAM-dependent methyltransferase